MHSLPKRPQVNLNSIEENKSNMNLKNEKKSEDAIVESILLAKEQLITVSWWLGISLQFKDAYFILTLVN